MVKIIPVIYGIQESDMGRMKARQDEGRLTIGNAQNAKQGKLPMFGCRERKGRLPKYGTF